jgi:hypothetical protein
VAPVVAAFRYSSLQFGYREIVFSALRREVRAMHGQELI